MNEPKPCPICGAELQIHGPEDWKPSFYDPDSGGDPYNATCDCGFYFSTWTYDYPEFFAALNRRAPLPDNKALTVEELRERKKPVWCDIPDCKWIPEGGFYCLCENGVITPPSKQTFSAEECLKMGGNCLTARQRRGSRRCALKSVNAITVISAALAPTVSTYRTIWIVPRMGCRGVSLGCRFQTNSPQRRIDMERLTKKHYQDVECDAPYVTSGVVNCGDCFEGAVLDRLAAYEDTGLEPEEVVALKEAEQKRRGRCEHCISDDCMATGYEHHCEITCERCRYNLRDKHFCPHCGRDLRGDNHGT